MSTSPWSLTFLATLLALPLSARADDAFLEPIRERYELPALAAMAARSDGVAFVDAVGVRKLGDDTPATVDDRWHLGSCGKAMTATLVATFVEEGALTWTTTLGELFGDVDRIDRRYAEVTLETLLAHRGAIPSIFKHDRGALWRTLWDLPADEGRRRAALELLRTPPAHEPGTRFEYSNAGYMLAGYALERMTGKSFEVLLRERVLVPLGMTSCGFGAAGNAGLPHPDEPWGHAQTPVGYEPIEPGPGADNPPAMSPAGTVHCSLADWSRFALAHLAGARGEPTAILRAESYARLHTPLVATHPYTPGGWIVYSPAWSNGPALIHDGSNTLSYSIIAVAPGLDAALLTAANAGSNDAADGTFEALVGMAELVRAR